MTSSCWYDFDAELICISHAYIPEFVKDCQRIEGRRWDNANKWNTFPITSAPDVKILAEKWSIEVDESLEQEPQWDLTPIPERLYDVFLDGKIIAIYFPYKEEMVHSIHETISSSGWNDPKRRWEVSTYDAIEAVVFAEKWGLTVEPTLAQQSAAPREMAEKNYALSSTLEAEPFDITGISGTLRPYQFAGVKYALQNHRVILADSPGLGKTLQSISVVEIKNALPCVVVCKSKLKGVWRDEIKKWFPAASVMVVGGTQPYPVPSNIDFIVVNYDVVYGWYENLIQRGFNSMIIDESHYIKNGKRKFSCSVCAREMRGESIKKCPNCGTKDVKAKRTYSVRRTNAVMQLSLALPDSAPILALTGTPIENRPRELIRQLECIDRLSFFGGESKFSYRYCDMDGKGATNSEELHRKLRAICYMRRRTKDVFSNLPDEQYIPRFLEVSDEAMERYRVIEKDVVEYFAQRAAEWARAMGDDAELAAYNKREQLRRIEDMVEITGLRSAVAEIKREAVVDWIKDFDEDSGGEEKLVIFGEHISLVDHLAEEFASECINFRSAKDTRAAEVQFQTDPTIRKWIANLQASKEGFTLTAASNVVFCELPWSPTWMTQGLGRVHGRANDVHPGIGYGLLVKDTIDEEMWEMLEKKREIVDAVTDGISIPEDKISVREQLRLAWLERGKTLLNER